MIYSIYNEDDDEIIIPKETQEYLEKGDFSDLHFKRVYDKYSSWRIKEVFAEAGFRLQPVYLGYKALRYRPCQRYFIINEKTNEKFGDSPNGYSFEDLRYYLASCDIPLHGENYKNRKTRDKNGRRYACEEFLQIVNALDNPADKSENK